MFYFTCNESKIYDIFTFWNKLQEKMNSFTIFWFFEVHLYFRSKKISRPQYRNKICIQNKSWIIFLTKALSDFNERTAETHGDGMCQQLTVLMMLVLSVIRSKCLFTYVCEAKHSQDFCDTMPHKWTLRCFQALVLGLLRVPSKSSSSFHSNEFHL